MELRKLEISEHNRTRSLWESIFTEDSKEFLDYYYKYKADNNQIYTIEQKGKICAMLQLNPYHVKFGSAVYKAHYIIAVATAMEYRHQGLMKQLLIRSILDMYQAKEPFTYLMPAAEKIYTPFDFRYIYNQRVRVMEGMEVFREAGLNRSEDLEEPKVEAASLFIDLKAEKVEKDNDIEALAAFSNQWMDKRYDVYTVRDTSYYKVLQEELRSEQGDIVILKNEEQIAGCFFYAVGDFIEVREPIILEGLERQLLQVIRDYFEDEEKKIRITALPEELGSEEDESKPIIMARIVHLSEFVKQLKSEENLKFSLQVIDPVIPENHKAFMWEITPQGGHIQEISSKEELPVIEISALASLFFGYFSIEELVSREEIYLPEELVKQLDIIKPLNKIFINEIV
jgi:predicted acetyltransferase